MPVIVILIVDLFLASARTSAFRSVLRSAFRSIVRPVSRSASVRSRSWMTVMVRPSFRSCTEARTLRPHLFPCLFLFRSQDLLHVSAVFLRHLLHCLPVCRHGFLSFLGLLRQKCCHFLCLSIGKPELLLESVNSHFNPLCIAEGVSLRLHLRPLRSLCEHAAKTCSRCCQYCNYPFHIPILFRETFRGSLPAFSPPEDKVIQDMFPSLPWMRLWWQTAQIRWQTTSGRTGNLRIFAFSQVCDRPRCPARENISL